MKRMFRTVPQNIQCSIPSQHMFEIHVECSYVDSHGNTQWADFTNYVQGKNAAEAEKKLRDKLERENYFDIKLDTYLLR